MYRFKAIATCRTICLEAHSSSSFNAGSSSMFKIGNVDILKKSNYELTSGRGTVLRIR